MQGMAARMFFVITMESMYNNNLPCGVPCTEYGENEG